MPGHVAVPACEIKAKSSRFFFFFFVISIKESGC